MAIGLQGADLATASTIYRDATDVTIRNRLVMAYLEKEGRIDRNFEGKDMNWNMDYKQLIAQPYTRQQLNFNDDNFLLPATQAPVFWISTSGMDWIDKRINTGPTMIIDNFRARSGKLLQAMNTKLYKDFYSDNAVNTTGVTGIMTMFKRNVSNMVCTNADRVAVPISGTLIHGLSLQPQAYGGSWSNNLPQLLQPSTVLGSDWPDGQGDASQLYDVTTPRLYNWNTNQWLNPGDPPANGTWRQNCLSELMHANTDLKQNSIKTMMPTVHICGSTMMTDVKEQLRVSFRDTMVNTKAQEDLGYYDAYNLEGAAIDLDYEAPANYTISVCAASMEGLFYGETGDDEGGRSGRASQEGYATDDQILGGIYTLFPGERIPGTLQYAWICVAGGNMRYQPRWCAAHHDFTTGA
jgi:hypothetical protein